MSIKSLNFAHSILFNRFVYILFSLVPQLSGRIAEFISAVNSDGAALINTTEMLAQSNTMDPKEFLQQQLKKPLGPDHINTLEQLKIELENITHAHMINTILVDNDTQFPADMLVNQALNEGTVSKSRSHYARYFSKQFHSICTEQANQMNQMLQTREDDTQQT